MWVVTLMTLWGSYVGWNIDDIIGELCGLLH